MTQEIKTPQKRAGHVEPAQEDLSAAIEQTVERQPDEEVRSVWLFDNCYRCNWWVRDKATQPAFLSTGTIRRSRFLRVTKAAGALVIQDATLGG